MQVQCHGTNYTSGSSEPCAAEQALDPGSTEFYTYIAICCGLVTAAGIFSGLTLGLLSLDPLTLRALKSGGHPHEQVTMYTGLCSCVKAMGRCCQRTH